MGNNRFWTVVLTCVLSSLVTMGALALIALNAFGGAEGLRQVVKYAELRGVIERAYIGEADYAILDDWACRAAVAALDDRWSYYMSAEEYTSYMEYSDNRYMGIGVTIEYDEALQLHKIAAVTPDSPADRAGIVAGEYIAKINGESVNGYNSSQIRRMILDSAEVLLLLRDGEGAEREVRVAAELIYTDPVVYELLGAVGYIRLRNFEAGSADGALNAIEELTALGARALVFDVRSNPGGKVHELTRILDALLPEGDIISLHDKSGESTLYTSDAACIELPMTVLINGDSYSAAEFFAAALSEYGRAYTVGEATTGKGRAQVTFVLSDGSAVHISSSVYLTPKGVDLSKAGGLVPDFEVPVSAEERAAFASGRLSREEDSQLQRALELLGNAGEQPQAA